MLSGPLLGEIQALGRHGRITRNKFDLKLPGNGNQGRLELIILNIVGVGRVIVARYDLVGRYNPY